MSLEMGAPITMAREMQAEAGVGHADGFIEALEAQEERWTLPNGDTLLREPIGPAGLITPWNWPINQIALKVLPALATGCPAILKPSEHTPLSAQIYAEILHDAGVPAGGFRADPRDRGGGGRHARPASGPRHGLLHRLHPRGNLRDQRPPPRRSSASRWNWAASPPTSSSPIAAMRWRIAFAPRWPNASSTPASPATRPRG
jgi:hypothetical protein